MTELWPASPVGELPKASTAYMSPPLTTIDEKLGALEIDSTKGADALLIATEWKEFRSPDFDRLKQSLQQPLIFDGRNLYDPVLMQRLGFEYFAIGRGLTPATEERVAALRAERR